MCLLPSIYVKLLETWLQLLTSDNNPPQPTSKIVELLCLLGHEKRKVGNRDQYKQFLEEAIKLHTENPNEFNQEKVSEAFFFAITMLDFSLKRETLIKQEKKLTLV